MREFVYQTHEMRHCLFFGLELVSFHTRISRFPVSQTLDSNWNHTSGSLESPTPAEYGDFSASIIM